MNAWCKLISIIDECGSHNERKNLILIEIVFSFLFKNKNTKICEKRKREIFFCSDLVFNIICNQAAQRRHVTVYIPN